MVSNFLIIGAGVAGLATAQNLLLQGAAVTLLERGLAGNESSWAGGGILSPLCPWDYTDAVTQLTSFGANLFPKWSADLHKETGVNPEYKISGMKVLSPFNNSLARSWCDKNFVVLEEQENALFMPNIAQVRNPRLIQALRKHIEMLGGKIIEGCEVQEISTKDDRVQSVVTSRGSYHADRYIVCAGAWSKQVLGQYALQIDIKPIRGQMLLFKFDQPPMQHILLQDGMYLIPRQDGHLLIGSTLEDVGFDKSTTLEARNSLMLRAQLLLPELGAMPLVQHWSGLRPGSPHNIPMIGRHPQLDNLYINSGHFRYGVTMAPASAAILMNELLGVEQPFDVSPYVAGWGVRNKT